MQVPYTNTKDRPVSIGGKRINPGETRSVEQTFIPGYTSQAAPGPAPRDPVLEILDDSVKAIVPKLADLSEEDFARVRQAEADGKSRSSLEKAFEEEALRRAEKAAEGGGSQGAEGNASTESENSGNENGDTKEGE